MQGSRLPQGSWLRERPKAARHLKSANWRLRVRNFCYVQAWLELYVHLLARLWLHRDPCAEVKVQTWEVKYYRYIAQTTSLQYAAAREC